MVLGPFGMAITRGLLVRTLRPYVPKAVAHTQQHTHTQTPSVTCSGKLTIERERLSKVSFEDEVGSFGSERST